MGAGWICFSRNKSVSRRVTFSATACAGPPWEAGRDRGCLSHLRGEGGGQHGVLEKKNNEKTKNEMDASNYCFPRPPPPEGVSY